jgi:protoporphyrinogen oxidase
MAGDALLIVGAGPAGLALSASYIGPSRIIEAGSEVGGLCRSVEFGGCVFDIGGHSFHTPHAGVAELVDRVMPGGLEMQRRTARVWFDGALIDYPFQQHVGQIGNASIRDECVRLLPPPGAPRPPASNFEEWIAARFGAGIARHFMLPYNRKLWARDLREMSADWVGERVAGADAVRADAKPGRSPLMADALVGYPREGGFGAIFTAMARSAGPVALGERMVAVDIGERVVRTASGAQFAYDRLVSAAPLPELLRCIAGCPPVLVAAAERLQALSLKILMLACDKGREPPPQRIYCADADVPAHKIAFNHRSSAALKARKKEAVICEISYSPAKPAPDEATLTNGMIDWLIDRDLVGNDRTAVEARIIDVPLGYPVPTPDRQEIVTAARAWLEPRSIYSIGRFGGWHYANSDGCIQEAMELTGRL